MFAKTAIVALFAALTAAQLHQPVGDPSGNPTSRPSEHESVPKGEPFTITWTPTTPNTISILLVKGPSSNVVPIATLVEGYENKGTFTWTPSESLESTGDRLYGIQIIDDVNGQYQWSPQFGLTGETTTPSSSAVSKDTEGYPTATPSLSHYPTELSSSAKVNSTSAPSYPESSHHASITISASVSSGYPGHNTTIVQPTKTPTVPATLKTTATDAPTGTGSAPPESTGAAAGLKAGLGLAGIMAAAAAFL